jgi:MFS family permease
MSSLAPDSDKSVSPVALDYQTPVEAVTQRREAASLRELSPEQWKTGIAAWLGWLFDGLDMHLYVLVAAPFVAQLLNVADTTDKLVKEKSSWIQAAFLIGWALGGGFFGRLGDRLGRSRALGLTILTYALFTGLAFFSTAWWHLMIFRFLAALGIGGEWAVGSSLLSETWPRRWRAWIAAVLQTGVNIGVLLACLAVIVLAKFPERTVFLVGVLPALLVFWIRRSVPEPAEWHSAMAAAGNQAPGIGELFRGKVRRTTILTIIVCACSLSAWWAFMFWSPQHISSLPEVASWSPAEKQQLRGAAFFLVMFTSIFGNFFAAWLARWLGYRRSIAIMCLCFFLITWWTYGVERDHVSLMIWTPWIGFCSGVFGLFTMYLPPLFPTLLRTTGAGFCYNIGRIVAAFGTIFSGWFSKGGDFRHALIYAGFLYIPAMLVAVMLPDLRDDTSPTAPLE